MPAKWRLSRTLKRKLEFRDLVEDDIRYLWAAYKKGSLASMGERFADTNMEAPEFKEAFAEELATNYHRFWALIGPTKRGLIPVGFVLAFWSHPEPRLAPFMVLNLMLWMPWASTRNKVESAVHFLTAVRNEIPMVGYSRYVDQAFFNVLARHGVMRRVGTSFNVFPGEQAAVYETRST